MSTYMGRVYLSSILIEECAQRISIRMPVLWFPAAPQIHRDLIPEIKAAVLVHCGTLDARPPRRGRTFRNAPFK